MAQVPHPPVPPPPSGHIVYPVTKERQCPKCCSNNFVYVYAVEGVPTGYYPPVISELLSSGKAIIEYMECIPGAKPNPPSFICRACGQGFEIDLGEFADWQQKLRAVFDLPANNTSSASSQTVATPSPPAPPPPPPPKAPTVTPPKPATTSSIIPSATFTSTSQKPLTPKQQMKQESAAIELEFKQLYFKAIGSSEEQEEATRKTSEGTKYVPKKEFKRIYLPFPQLKEGKSPSKKVRIVCLSDTHEREEDLIHRISSGDVLIHTGDFTQGHENFVEITQKFNEFLGKMKEMKGFTYIICISGNHDYALDGRFYKKGTVEPGFAKKLLSNATHYLEHEALTLQFGPNASINLFACPFGNYGDMAFTAPTEQRLKYFSTIPEGIDILLTHTPCFNVLDLAYDKRNYKNDVCQHCSEKHMLYNHWGCPVLREQVLNRIKPRIHIFGHVHDDYGHLFYDKTLFVNAAMKWGPMRPPVCFDYLFFDSSTSNATLLSLGELEKKPKNQACIQS